MECAVCYCELNVENIVNTKCSHQFCNICFWKWANDNNTCPMCRDSIVTSNSLKNEEANLRGSIFELTQEETNLYDRLDFYKHEHDELERNVFSLRDFQRDPRKHMKKYMKKRRKHFKIKKEQAKEQKLKILLQLESYSTLYDNYREVLSQIKFEKSINLVDSELSSIITSESLLESLLIIENSQLRTPSPRNPAQSPPPLYRNRWGGEIESDEEL